MQIATDAAFILPDDFANAALMGRVWRPDLAGPSVVAIRENGVFDISDEFPTASQLAASDPAEALRATKGVRIGALQDILNNTPPDTRDPAKPWLLAPIDLQVIKAAGVTFAVSMLERVIEERARGNPDSAQAIRAEVTRIVGTDLSQLKPGSAEAQHVKDVLVSQNAWSQYLEVGIGPDAEVFTKAPVAVGGRHLRGCGPASEIDLEQSGARGGAGGDARRPHRRRDARQRRQSARLRGTFGAAAVQGQGQQRLLRHRAVRAVLRPRLHARRRQEDGDLAGE